MRGRNKKQKNYLVLDSELNLVKILSQEQMEQIANKNIHGYADTVERTELWKLHQKVKRYLDRQDCDDPKTLYQGKYFIVEDE